MRVVEAILFDIDGTLLDTSEFIFQAFEHALKHAGFPDKKRGDIAPLIGKPLSVCYQLLTGFEDVELLCVKHRTFQAGHIDLARAYPHTEETLEALRESGLKIAAVTTRTKDTAVETIEFTGLSKYLDYLVAFEDVEHLKPHPEPIIKTLDYLKTQPHASIMVGDTDVDILAGRSAGTITVGVTYGFHGDEIKKSRPDYVVDEIAEIVPLVLPLFERQL